MFSLREDGQAPATARHRGDYQAPAWWIDTVDLTFDLDPAKTRVLSRMHVRRNSNVALQPLRLDGDELNLARVMVNGAGTSFRMDAGQLVLENLPQDEAGFDLEIFTTCAPEKNTALMGLYVSQGTFFTQCEAEGFRRITYFLDRPDVMASYQVLLRADKAQYPVLLSNGNLVEQGDLDGGRHFAKWVDPHKKPCYLFALVAGKLVARQQRITSRTGKEHLLEVYVRPGDLGKTEHAMHSLMASVAWDETRFGLSLDLERFMIVATSDFNMGAMENKGLNVFNTKYVLASQATATDVDFSNIESVVGHEYFHNWTGNRVTCRDWFQLSLKEGLTVFRDQEFGADVHSRAVTRIQEVRQLRVAQFPEDAGPMAHPIRPASYAEINNFYTATVYEKGAEVIRMIHTLIGRDKFRQGMDLYFARHDGQAVTCEDFVAAMQDASKVDLGQFRRWYARAGTPHLKATGTYDAAAKRYTLTLAQSLAPTAYERKLQEAGIAIDDGPLHIPVAVGLVLPDGSDASPSGTQVLSLTAATQSIVFENIAAAPVASLLRGFSAPVHLDFEQTDAELAHLMAHDSDAFNRWEAGQRLATRVLLAGIAVAGAGSGWIPDAYIAAVARVLDDGLTGDPALAAEALVLPAEQVLAEEVAGRGQAIDPEAIHAARLALRRHLAALLRDQFEAVWQALAPTAPYAPDGAQVGRRALRNLCLAYLAESEAAHLKSSVMPRLLAQLDGAGNMTDVMAALGTLANLDLPEREAALAAFHEKWKDEALVVDKWLQVQATSRLPGTAQRVRELMRHAAFDIRNPNKVYALVRAFCGANPRHFHAADGEGYRLAADAIIELQAMNPQVASRIARSFDRWRKFDAGRQSHARAALERIQACAGLARDVAEVVGNALK